MPVATVPGPSVGSEACLGWAPVVPLAGPPPVPNVLGAHPLPSDRWWWGVLTPMTKGSTVSRVLLKEAQAFGLGAENGFVFSVDSL